MTEEENKEEKKRVKEIGKGETENRNRGEKS